MSKKKMDFLKQFKNIVVYNLNNKSYNQICRVIFSNYFKNDVILVGKTKHILPISTVHRTFNKNDIIYILRSVTTATFSFRFKKPMRIDGKDVYYFVGDTFKLWSKAYLLDIYKWRVDELFKITFKTDDISKVKVWGIYLSDINKYPEHAARLHHAKLSYPIYIYDNIIVDGYHRLIKAKLMGLKYIKYYKLTSTVMKTCHISKKKLYKYRRNGSGFIRN
jgi:hypothetical protein